MSSTTETLSYACCLCFPQWCRKDGVNAFRSQLGLLEEVYGEPFPQSFFHLVSKHFLHTCSWQTRGEPPWINRWARHQPFPQVLTAKALPYEVIDWGGDRQWEWWMNLENYSPPRGSSPKNELSYLQDYPAFPHQYPYGVLSKWTLSLLS